VIMSNEQIMQHLVYVKGVESLFVRKETFVSVSNSSGRDTKVELSENLVYN